MTRIIVAAAALGAAMLLTSIAAAADDRSRLHHSAGITPPQWPVCYISRYAYVRYAPVLATSRSVRLVVVSTPVPCPARG